VIQKKICLLGDFSVGKTSLVRRFVEGRYDEKYHSTIGVSVMRRRLDRPAGALNFILWDLAGGENDAHSSNYLIGAAGGLIVCDLTRPETLQCFTRCAAQLRAVNPQAVLVFAANKVDLVETRCLGEDALREASAGGPLVYTSAKTGEQVARAFELLAEQLEARA
jgi:small GTP-binding protein